MILTRVLATSAAAAVLSGVAVTAFAGPASASIGSGHFQLCAQGNYSAESVFVNSAGRHHDGPVVVKGGCHTSTLPANTTVIEVFGLWNSGSGTFSLGQLGTDGQGHACGAKGSTANSAANAYLDCWQ